MKEHHTILNIEDISYDNENPRIKMALEKYGDKLDAEKIHFALRSASENGTRGTSSYNGLKYSILASKGVMTPISVIKKRDRYICIDGNTRLAIYKEFNKEGAQGDWSKIKAIVLEDSNQHDVEKIRVSAHLIGPRAWPAYEKARYLHYLRNQKFMDYSEMIALCGGNKAEIERKIDAYNDMNEYYRDVVEDDAAFKIERYSGFEELQKSGIKDAIFEAGLKLKDFGEWIRDGKIHPLNNVRELPKVLRDAEAKERFLNGGPRSIEDAKNLLNRKAEQERESTTGEITLENANVYHLAESLIQRINKFPLEELSDLKNRKTDENAERIITLETLSERLHVLLENVSE